LARNRRKESCVTIRLTLALILVTSAARAGDHPCVNATAWPEADLLFRSSSNWLGADGAYSIYLGDERTLWLFGDTWIDAVGSGSRRNAKMVRNSVAIQRGLDPSQAIMEFFWKSTHDGSPGAFFETGTDEWYWPGHGVRTEHNLVLFLNRLRRTSTGLGFESVGWAAVMVDSPADEPPTWRINILDAPPDSFGIQVGFASALRIREHVYAFGSADPDKTHSIYAVRWPLADVAKGRLVNPEWWGGTQAGWNAENSRLPREPLLTDAQAEMTIHFDYGSGQFLAVQSVGFGKAHIAIRSAPSMTGQWSAPKTIFEPPENDRPNMIVYAGKAHPQLEGADLVLTYATNNAEFSEHFSVPDSYYPHFIRLSRCANR